MIERLQMIGGDRGDVSDDVFVGREEPDFRRI
jgi:hypothetical protein